METSKLIREKFLNPFFFNDRMIADIILYNKEGIIVNTGIGWFGNNNDLPFLNVPLIKVKRKEDFTHKGAFVLPAGKCSLGNAYTLYLQVDNINVKIIETKEFKKNFNTDIHVCNTYKVDILGTVCSFEKCVRVERTDKGKELDKWYDILQGQRIDINKFTLSLLLEKYNLVER